MTRRLGLSIATLPYDHICDLVTESVRFEGIDPLWLDLPVEEILQRFVGRREWDVSEISMAQYASLVAAGDHSLTAIPVFPARMFRHSAIYVRTGAHIARPVDLAGRRVGVPEWAQTAGVYARGVLTHEYGVALGDVRWVQAGINEPGRLEHVAVDLPEGVDVERRPGHSLNDLLCHGEVDAVISARPPRAFTDGDARVARLFAEPQRVEQEYALRTGVFPIMHTVAVRRDVVDRHPWVPTELFKGFSRARDNSVARLMSRTVSLVPMPWARESADEAWDAVGDRNDPWPYGVGANATTLATFLDWAFEQGVCQRRLDPSDLFWPEVENTSRT